MGNRLAEDIKRIVGIDPNQNILGAAAVKAALLARRGIGYFNPSTGGVDSISGTPNQTQLSATKGIGDTSTGANKSGEEGLDSKDPQNGVMNPTTGQSDAADIIDGLNSASKVTESQTTDSGLVYENNDSLNSMLAKDCNTGETLEIRFRNDFIPPDAVLDSNDNELTSEWEDANVAPEVAGYEAGKYWELSGSGAPSNPQNFSAYQVGLDGLGPLNAFGGDAPYTFNRLEVVNPSVTNVYYDGATAEINLVASKLDCTGVPPEEAATCPASAPTEDAWPVSDKYVLKLDGGQFVSSEFDSEVPANHKNPASQIDFCFGDGGSRTGTVEATKNNGYMVYETSGGSPTGIVRVYDSVGQLTAAFDGTSGLIDSYRP